MSTPSGVTADVIECRNLAGDVGWQPVVTDGGWVIPLFENGWRKLLDPADEDYMGIRRTPVAYRSRGRALRVAKREAARRERAARKEWRWVA